MISQLWISIGAAVLMAGLLVEALIFRAMYAESPSVYKLFAVRDKLVRLVVEGKIDRHEPHFEALYANVTLLLESSRHTDDPHAWDLAQSHERHWPESLLPVIKELRAALESLIDDRLNVIGQLDSHRRTVARIRKTRAKALLTSIPG